MVTLNTELTACRVKECLCVFINSLKYKLIVSFIFFVFFVLLNDVCNDYQVKRLE